jgi:hypothetical protein
MADLQSVPNPIINPNQIRYRMYKQIIFFFFLSFAGFLQKKDKIPVFENKKRIVFLNEETTNECDNCYYFDSENIFNKKIIFRLQIRAIGVIWKRFIIPG